MNNKIIESVPNFSEGRDKTIIDYICSQIESVEGAKIMNVDMGYDANRTVITFVATIEAMKEAAFRAIKSATEKIDMRVHKGEHPRIGATDVMPFIPLSNATIDDCIEVARQVGERAAAELGIGIYCYESAAFHPHKQNLAECRKGEYQGIKEKIVDDKWSFDFGATQFTDSIEKSGVTVIGARDFLVAINFNLDTKNVDIAKQIAKEVRWSGYVKDGERLHGALAGVKAIGWWMERYNCAQISINIVNSELSPLEKTYKTVCEIAQKYGCQIVGTELIGMIPERIALKAAADFNAPKELSSREMIEFVAKTMNINTPDEFVVENKIIEYSNGYQTFIKYI